MQERIPGWLRDHASLVAAFMALAFIALRVAAVAGFNSTSAMAVLSTQGTANVLAAVLIDSWDALTLIVLVVLLVGSVRPGDPRFVKVDWALWVGLALVLVFTVPWFVPVLVLLAIVISAVRQRFAGTQNVEEIFDARSLRLPQKFVALMVLFFIVSTATNPTPWLPPEQFDLGAAGGKRLVGYALGTDGDDLLILQEKDRQVIRVNESTVQSRVLCMEDRPGLLDVPRIDLTAAPVASLALDQFEPTGYPACSAG